jgi:predicted Zn-dependent peptidase
MRFLPEHLKPALGLLREVLSEPAFPAKECETAKIQAVQEIKHLEDEPLSKVFVLLKELYFGTEWGHFELGAESSLSDISRADIESFWKARYIPAGTIVAAAGKFDPDQMAKEVETLFANSSDAWPLDNPPVPERRKVSRHIQKDSEQTQIALAFPCVPRNHPSYYVARAAVGVLSGGMSGRLFTEVREKRALVYAVGAQAVSLRGTGAVYAYAGTTAPRAAETLSVLKAELLRLGQDATTEEVERAKIGFKAHMLMDQESTGARARELLDDIYHDNRIVPVSEVITQIDAVTAEDVKAYWTANPVEPYTLVTLGRDALE